MGEQGSPGPWTVNDSGDVVDSEGRLVAHLQDRAYQDGKYLEHYFDASDAARIADAWAIPDLIAALIREHDANHPNPAGPTCGCSTCQLLTRLGDPGDGRR